AKKAEDWHNCSQDANNLSEMLLLTGQISSALEFAEQSVKFAELSGSARHEICSLVVHAAAYHISGQLDKSRKMFLRAERLQARTRKDRPRLTHFESFLYCDFLLSGLERRAWKFFSSKRRKFKKNEIKNFARAIADIEIRAKASLSEARHDKFLASEAFHLFTLGRVALYRGIVSRDSLNFGNITDCIEKSYDAMRRAGQQNRLPRIILTRAWLSTLMGEKAEKSIIEAHRIAESGGLKLCLADVYLYRARLFRDKTD